MTWCYSQAWFSELDRFLLGKPEDGGANTLLITGANGVGKSALLSNWVRRLKKQKKGECRVSAVAVRG